MEDLERLLQKDRIIDRLNDVFISTDQKKWHRVKACFTSEVLFDMSSLTGQIPQRISAEHIARNWEQALAVLEAAHHQVGNYRITLREKDADAFCYAIATHYRRASSGKNTRTFVGTYDFHLVRDRTEWRIDSFKFNLKYVDGNLHLEND